MGWHHHHSPPASPSPKKGERILLPRGSWFLGTPESWVPLCEEQVKPQGAMITFPVIKYLSFKKSSLLFFFGEEIIQRSENDLRQVQIIIFTNFSTQTNVWGLAKFNWPHFELMIIISNKRSSWRGNPKRRLLWACSTNFPQERVHTFPLSSNHTLTIPPCLFPNALTFGWLPSYFRKSLTSPSPNL